MKLAVEELLAIVIESAGGVIKVPADDFKTSDLTNKVIAIDTMNDGAVVVLTLVEKDEVIFDE